MRDPREDAVSIALSAVSASLPERVLPARVRVKGERIIVGRRVFPMEGGIRILAMGKAAPGMARAMLDILGHVDGGIVVSPSGESVPPLTALRGEHPVPGPGSFRAGEAVMDYISSLGPRDILICLISGGASSLVELPAVNPGDYTRGMELLLSSGADIHEMNAVRKHLSLIKGGGIARATDARILSLIMSDVVGDDVATIASGPTAPDPTTFGDALRVLTSRGLLDRMPGSVVEYLRRGAEGLERETLKPREFPRRRVANVVIWNVGNALAEAARRARGMGYRCRVLTDHLRGEAREVGRAMGAMADGLHRNEVFLLGGETTVKVEGRGRGGPNQELALSASRGLERGIVVALDTDGVDGNSPAAGGIAFSNLWGDGAEEALRHNDSYTYLSARDAAIITGPTGTNVNSVVVLLRGREG